MCLTDPSKYLPVACPEVELGEVWATQPTARLARAHCRWLTQGRTRLESVNVLGVVQFLFRDDALHDDDGG